MAFALMRRKGAQAEACATGPVPCRLVARATAAAATAASARGAAGGLSGSAVTRTVRRAEHRKLNRALLPRALRAGNLLRLVQHNLLKVRLAILTNVFVNRHIPILTASVNNHSPSK